MAIGCDAAARLEPEVATVELAAPKNMLPTWLFPAAVPTVVLDGAQDVGMSWGTSSAVASAASEESSAGCSTPI